MDNNAIFLDNLPITFDLPVLAKRLRIREGQTKFLTRLEKVAADVAVQARPKAIAWLSVPEILDDTHVRVDGITFTSRLLREKVDGLNRVFTFVVTEGRELRDWADALDSSLEQVYAGALREAVCNIYWEGLETAILERYGMTQISYMQPGSLPEEWPLEEQIPLFELLKPYTDKMGVLLNDSLLMEPFYSVSGIYFQTDKKFYNCQLCPRENCPNRKAAYAAA